MATLLMPMHRYVTQTRTVMKPRSPARWLSNLMGAAALLITGVAAAGDVPGVTVVRPIPAQLQHDTFYSAALANAVKQPEAAAALMRFLASPEAAPAISKAGLAPLSGR